MGKDIRFITTDVLVIGGGGGGMMAAIYAKREGVGVTLVSKGKIGDSGNTIMIGGSFSIDGESAYKGGYHRADRKNTRSTIYKSIIKQGFYMSDQNLVKQFVNESPLACLEVIEWGKKAKQSFVFTRPGTWVTSGRSLGCAFLQGLKESEGILQINDVMMIDLIKSGTRITGAVGINIYDGSYIIFNAKAVVLATGGFNPFSFKNTNSDMTGDGIAMAYRAGAKLSDMEFFLYCMTAITPEYTAGSLLPFIYFFTTKGIAYRALDGQKKEIQLPHRMKKIEKSSELSKLIHLYYYGRVIADGQGTENNGIYIDCSKIPDFVLDISKKCMKNIFSHFYKKGYYHAIDLEQYFNDLKKKQQIEVGLGAEYSIGGIVVNEKMETMLLGLYAAGECTSGLFGANRTADAVTEMIVQGKRAGASAADFAKRVHRYDNDMNAENQIIQFAESIFENREGRSVTELRKQLEEVADSSLGYTRDETSLNSGLQKMVLLCDEISKTTLSGKDRLYNTEWIQALHTRNLADCTRLSIVMALQRKESRGTHIRTDYPEIDNDHFLEKNIVCRNSGKDVFSRRKPISCDVSLPVGKYSYVQYLSEISNAEGIG